MAPSDSLIQRFLWENRKNGILEALFQLVNDIVQMRDIAHSICHIKLYSVFQNFMKIGGCLVTSTFDIRTDSLEIELYVNIVVRVTI